MEQDNIEDVVTTGFYTESDLIAFGNYLLSKERYILYKKTHLDVGIPLKERLSVVSDSDLRNFFNTVRR